MENSIGDWIKANPLYAIGGLLLAALLIYGVVQSKKVSQVPSDQPVHVGDLSGLETQNGVPVIYRVAEDDIISTTIIEDSYNQNSNNTVTPAPVIIAPPPAPVPPAPAPSPSGPPAPVPTPAPLPKPVVPPPAPAPKKNVPLIPYNYFSSHKFPTEAGTNSTVRYFSYGGINYAVVPGAGGRIWGIRPADGKQILLYAPASYY